MKNALRYSTTLAVLVATLLLVSWALATSDKSGPAVDKEALPKQTGTHFFEIYHCGELAGVVWVTPGEAALFRVQNLHSPQLRASAMDIREKAREQGTAFAVHGKKGGCAGA